MPPPRGVAKMPPPGGSKGEVPGGGGATGTIVHGRLFHMLHDFLCALFSES